MIDLNTNILVVTLISCTLNIPVKMQFQTEHKAKYSVHKYHILNIKIHREIKVLKIYIMCDAQIRRWPMIPDCCYSHPCVTSCLGTQTSPMRCLSPKRCERQWDITCVITMSNALTLLLARRLSGFDEATGHTEEHHMAKSWGQAPASSQLEIEWLTYAASIIYFGF